MLLGEGSHGTHEFYAERAALTRRLIEAGRVQAVAIEGDWPDAYRVNRYVLGHSLDQGPEEALAASSGSRRGCGGTRTCSSSSSGSGSTTAGDRPPSGSRFYGLDLYSLGASIDAVIGYLETVDPAEAARARVRYGCFDRFGGPEGQAYGYALASQRAIPCEDEVVAQLVALRARTAEYIRRDGMDAFDEAFFAEQNAVRGARRGGVLPADVPGRRVVLEPARPPHGEHRRRAARAPRSRAAARPRIAVWEHNSHVGDARATGMSAHGELNVGQLVRQRYGAATVLVGFTTYDGEVTAAARLGCPRRTADGPARPASTATRPCSTSPGSTGAGSTVATPACTACSRPSGSSVRSA